MQEVLTVSSPEDEKSRMQSVACSVLGLENRLDRAWPWKGKRKCKCEASAEYRGRWRTQQETKGGTVVVQGFEEQKNLAVPGGHLLSRCM